MSILNLYTVHVTVAATDRLFEVHSPNRSYAIAEAHDWIKDRHPAWKIVCTPFVYLVREVDDETPDILRTLRVDYHGDSHWKHTLPPDEKVISVKLHRLTTWQEVKDTLVDVHDIDEGVVDAYLEETGGLVTDEVLDLEDLEFEAGYDIEESNHGVYVAVNWNAERLSAEDCLADAYEWIDEHNGIKECFLILSLKSGTPRGVINVIEPGAWSVVSHNPA